MPILTTKELTEMHVGQTYILPYVSATEVHNMRQQVSYAAERAGYRIIVSKDRENKKIKVSRIR